ncbi:GNAT family N-acetyltransferase [Dyadobacter frigoris]|uniref:GNAT family N-acetyltransferase n=1 Tax=Dyadobacter frigoris TaxID=2576211 RepID=A0A4U6DAU8_9BACT|nr:GNAT family N-acetyltransferase [Dyadobacter frigoris]TKT93447.1 GNAT family N-acetyltransferase [Dyadobacter frigoris]GLU55829.1 N-acetyltransferase [Dyadobacter frigoris]
MTNQLQISQIGNTHSAQVIDLILPIQQIEFGVPITLKDQPDLLDIENNYHATGGNFWGAIYDEKVIGTIALIGIGNGQGVIRKMFVNKDFRGKEFGLAQQLLENLIDYCKSENIADLYLGTVDILKAAIRFYERNNFVKIEKKNLPAAFPIMSADNVFYHLEIAKL